MPTLQEQQKSLPSQRKPGGRPPSASTGVNLEERGPIDPRMPNAPPA